MRDIACPLAAISPLVRITVAPKGRHPILLREHLIRSPAYEMMDGFLSLWSEAAHTTLGLFWMAFWAFGFGYLISSMIQVFVTRERMKQSMGEAGPKSVALGTGFGFISSVWTISCAAASIGMFRARP